MDNKEKAIRLFSEIKTCPEADTARYFDAITQAFPPLETNDKMELAKEFYDWAMQNAAPGSSKLPFANYTYGLAHFFNDNYEDGLAFCDKAHTIFEEQNNKDGAAITLFGKGVIHRSLGNFDVALNTLWDCYDYQAKAGTFPHLTFACSYQIASIYLERKNYHEALELFEKTYTSADRYSNRVFIMNTLQGLGKTYLALNRFDEAKEAFEKALSMAEETNSPMFRSNMLSELSSYYFAVNDFEASEKYTRQTLALREQQHIIGGSITNLIQLAEIYTKQNKLSDAISVLQKGLALSEQIRVKPKIARIHLMLSELYERHGDMGKSLYHYKEYHKVHSEVETDDTARKIKNLRLVFEAEQTKKENIIIKQQKAEIEQKNIELQETIDELTRVKVSRKAKAFTFMLAIVLFVLVDLILEVILPLLPKNNFLLTLVVKILIIFSLKPVESGIEHYLLHKIIKKKKVLSPAMS